MAVSAETKNTYLFTKNTHFYVGSADFYLWQVLGSIADPGACC